jgi:hypothetical protein
MNNLIVFIAALLAIISVVFAAECVPVDFSQLSFCNDTLPQGWQIAKTANQSTQDARAQNIFQILTNNRTINDSCQKALKVLSCESFLYKCKAPNYVMALCSSMCEETKNGDCNGFDYDFSMLCSKTPLPAGQCYDGTSSAEPIRGAMVLAIAMFVIVIVM